MRNTRLKIALLSAVAIGSVLGTQALAQTTAPVDTTAATVTDSRDHDFDWGLLGLLGLLGLIPRKHRVDSIDSTRR